MFPAEGRDMGKEIIGDGRTESTRVLDGTVQVNRVPIDDRGGNEAQAGRTKTLVLKGSVTDSALAMKEHRAPERIAGLAFVEAGVTALAQIGVRQPLQGEQRSLDSAECAQGTRQGVAGAGGRKLAQDDRRHDRASLDRGFEPHEFSPLAGDRRGFDGIADQRFKQRIDTRFFDCVARGPSSP
jgi:hypothetical protein